MAAATSAGATVERINGTPEAINEALTKALEGATRMVMAEPDDLSPDLFSLFRESFPVITHPTEDQLASADAGVTDAFAGVGRTGSICLRITHRLGGAVSLFPRRHVAVLDAKRIVPRPRDVFSDEYLETGGSRGDFVFVTGPSATADMGSLVRGVHGPGKLHIILLE